MSLLGKQSEPNFIDKRRVWKSDLDRKRTRGMLLASIPAIVLCLFVVLSAPFIARVLSEFISTDYGEEKEAYRIDTAEETAPIEKQAPPRNPDLVIAEIYQKKFDEEGFDWRAKPVLETPVVEAAPEKKRELQMMNVEIPLDVPAYIRESDQPVE
ncbi:MAG: hypothetical protein AAGB46_02430 [Verrucomicrobiota bacterium]